MEAQGSDADLFPHCDGSTPQPRRSQRTKSRTPSEKILMGFAVAVEGEDTFWYAVPKKQNIGEDWTHTECNWMYRDERTNLGLHPTEGCEAVWFRLDPTASSKVFNYSCFGTVTFHGKDDPSNDAFAYRIVWGLSKETDRHMEIEFKTFLAKESVGNTDVLPERRSSVVPGPRDKKRQRDTSGDTPTSRSRSRTPPPSSIAVSSSTPPPPSRRRSDGEQRSTPPPQPLDTSSNVTDHKAPCLPGDDLLSLTITTFSGRSAAIRILKQRSVHELAARVESLLGVPREQMHFRRAGGGFIPPNAYSESLASLGLQDGDTLVLQLQPAGAPSSVVAAPQSAVAPSPPPSPFKDRVRFTVSGGTPRKAPPSPYKEIPDWMK